MCLPSVLTLFIFPWSWVTWTSVGLFFKVQISLCVLNLQFQVFENFQSQKSLWVFQTAFKYLVSFMKHPAKNGEIRVSSLIASLPWLWYLYKDGLFLGSWIQQLHLWIVQQILDEEKSKHAGLAQQSSFCPAFLLRILRLAKGIAKPNTYCWLAR